MSLDADAATVGRSIGTPHPERQRWVLGPPGIIVFLATGFAILAAFDANSRQSFAVQLFALGASTVVALVWLFRFLETVWRTHLRWPVSHWARWLAVPLLFVAAYLMTEAGVPFDVRLALSREAMNRAAAEVIAGDTTTRSSIGLYPVTQVERLPNGMRFLVAGSGMIDTIGFAWFRTGQPDPPDGSDRYEPLDGGWWLWIDAFD
jgi:hypothetical protein